MINFSWLLISYLLGSFPSGYLISRFSGKEILKIGWRKTSGSNVFREVGKWQGALTGILDVLKGYLAVWGAQRLGLSTEIQIFAAVAAITGHNWSVFLKFAGGRGVGTLIGAFLAISLKILGFSLIPFALMALIWTASIGTLIFLATAILISIYFNQFEIAGVFIILSLVPIFIKRLSPIGEIYRSAHKLSLIKNRLIFDDDQPCLDLRIKRIIRKIAQDKTTPNPTRTSISQKAKKIFLFSRPLITAPFFLPPKVAKYGLKGVKAGVRVAQKPIAPAREILSSGVKKLIFKTPEKVINEINQEDFKKMMMASAKKIVFHQEEINKINVFPVADKDTGYNLAATLLGIEGTVSQKEYKSFQELTKDIKEAALTNARGNAGMIFTGYLIRILDEIKNFDSVDSLKLARAMRKGIRAAYLSILNPVEGTILDPMKAAGEKAYEVAKIKKEKNIIKILEEAKVVSQKALEDTKEKLEVLKQNDVVDAGALGFVKILEAWLESLKELTPTREVAPPLIEFKERFKEPLKYRYCFQLTFKKGERDLTSFKKELSFYGNSIEFLETEDKIKIHIHTNQPGILKEKFQNLPGAEYRIEDMLEQMKKVQKKPLGLVVGQTADLPKGFLEKYEIEEIPFRVRFPDGEILFKENIFPKIREALKIGRILPTTSQPSLEDFLSAYQKTLEKFEKILVITLSSKLSGTYSAARIARSMLKEKRRVSVFDCFSAEAGEGLVVVKTQELISQGKDLEEILEELKKFCPQVKLLALVKDFSYVIRSGKVRIPKITAKLISLLQKAGFWVLVGIREGKIKFFGIRFGKNMAKILAEEIDRQREGKEIRVAVAQADNLKEALKLKTELGKKEKIKILFISQVSPVIGVYAGPGTLIVGFAPFG